MQRSKASKSLETLVHLQRVEATELRELTVNVTLRTPRQLLQAAEPEEETPKVLNEAGRDLGRYADCKWLPAAYEVDATLAAMGEALAAREPRSVLLVGASGGGEDGRRCMSWCGSGSVTGWGTGRSGRTSGSRLIAGAMGFGGVAGALREGDRGVCGDADGAVRGEHHGADGSRQEQHERDGDGVVSAAGDGAGAVAGDRGVHERAGGGAGGGWSRSCWRRFARSRWRSRGGRR